MPLHWDDGWRYEPRLGHAANSDRYLYLMGLEGREVGIRQTVYLPIEREREYRGVLFASSEDGPADLAVSFRKHNASGAVLALQHVTVPGREETETHAAKTPQWVKLAFRLSLPADAVAPLEPVDFAVSIRDNHRLSLDEIRLYPSDAVDGLLDPEIIRAAKALNSPLLRYGGNFTSGYHWRDGVGPVDKRPTKLNQSWGFPEYNEFGTDELMRFCNLIGARPQICLNLGSGTAEEAREWVEYCQGRPNTPQGARRAANGHSRPYDIAAWELGNELWGHFQIGWQLPQGYPQRYLDFYNAVHRLLPADTLLFANGADVDHFRDWNGELIAKTARELTYLTTHFVVGMEEMHKKDADREFKWAADFAIPVGVARGLEPMRAQIDSNPATRGKVKIAYTEWLFTAPQASDLPRWDNLGGAILGAAWMNMLLGHADLVPIADMTGLLEFAGIYKRRGRVYVTPQYWAFSLYSNHSGDIPVVTRTEVSHYDVHDGQRRVPEIQDVPKLDVLATRSSSTHDLVLFVVNRDWKSPIPASIDLRDFSPAPQARVYTLSGESILAHNDEEHPDAVHPANTSLNVPGNSLQYVFPEHSLTVLEFKPR